MGKSISSIHVMHCSTDEVWSFLCDIDVKNRYRIDDEAFIKKFVSARELAGITDYNEDDAGMMWKDMHFFCDYLTSHLEEHRETFYVVPIGKHVSVFSTYFCPPETEAVVTDLFGSCARKILTVDMLDEDFLKMDFFKGSQKRTSFAVGTNIEDIYGIVPCKADAEILKKEFGVDWNPIERCIPDYMKMLHELAEQLDLPVDLSIKDIYSSFTEQEIEKSTFSL